MYKEAARLPVEQRQFYCLQPSIAPHERDAGAVMVLALGDTTSPITAYAMGMV